jgi:hypothetical protein
VQQHGTLVTKTPAVLHSMLVDAWTVCFQVPAAAVEMMARLKVLQAQAGRVLLMMKQR